MRPKVTGNASAFSFLRQIYELTAEQSDSIKSDIAPDEYVYYSNINPQDAPKKSNPYNAFSFAR